MAARVFPEPEHGHPFWNALSNSYATREIALAGNAVGRSENTRQASAASLPALRKCAGVGSAGNSRGAGAALLETCGKRGMSVSSQANSTAARLARLLLGCAVRHWPEATRPWGLALAAEIDETASAFET